MKGGSRRSAAVLWSALGDTMNESLWNRDFIFGWVGLFFISSIMYMLNTTITEYATLFGATAVVAGLVSGIYTIGGLCSRLWGGSGLNKYGWKKVTLIFAFLQIIACGLYFIVSNVELLLVVRLVHGLAFGTCASGIITIGSSAVPKGKHGVGMGTFMLATTLAGGIGPYSGSLVIDAFGSQGGFIMAMAMSLGIFIFIACAKVEKDPARHRGFHTEVDEDSASTAHAPKGIRKFIEPAAVPISLCNLMFALSYAGVAAFVRLWSAENALMWIVAYFFIAQCAVQLICQPLFGKIQDLTGSDNAVMTIGMLAQVVGVGSMFFFPSVVTLFMGAIGTAMGYNTLKSVTQAVATRGVVPERRSYAVSTFWIFTDAGMGIGPALLGLAVGLGGYSYVFLVSAIICLAALPVYYIVWGLKDGKRHDAAVEEDAEQAS